MLCVVLALIAAFSSHTLKRPVPTPNLYSPHSYLGITTVILLGAQVCSNFLDSQVWRCAMWLCYLTQCQFLGAGQQQDGRRKLCCTKHYACCGVSYRVPADMRWHAPACAAAACMRCCAAVMCGRP